MNGDCEEVFYTVQSLISLLVFHQVTKKISEHCEALHPDELQKEYWNANSSTNAENIPNPSTYKDMINKKV